MSLALLALLFYHLGQVVKLNKFTLDSFSIRFIPRRFSPVHICFEHASPDAIHEDAASPLQCVYPMTCDNQLLTAKRKLDAEFTRALHKLFV